MEAVELEMTIRVCKVRSWHMGNFHVSFPPKDCPGSNFISPFLCLTVMYLVGLPYSLNVPANHRNPNCLTSTGATLSTLPQRFIPLAIQRQSAKNCLQSEFTMLSNTTFEPSKKQVSGGMKAHNDESSHVEFLA